MKEPLHHASPGSREQRNKLSFWAPFCTPVALCFSAWLVREPSLDLSPFFKESALSSRYRRPTDRPTRGWGFLPLPSSPRPLLHSIPVLSPQGLKGGRGYHLHRRLGHSKAAWPPWAKKLHEGEESYASITAYT